MTVRILIADDQRILRTILAGALDEELDFEVVGQAVDGREAVVQTLQLRPDVVLMDVTMPGLNGVEATRQIAAACPDVKVVGLSMHDSETMAGTMLAAGAAAYVEKVAPMRLLFGVIRDVVGLPKTVSA